jgi:hypothetical protein
MDGVRNVAIHLHANWEQQLAQMGTHKQKFTPWENNDTELSNNFVINSNNKDSTVE